MKTLSNTIQLDVCIQDDAPFTWHKMNTRHSVGENYKSYSYSITIRSGGCQCGQCVQERYLISFHRIKDLYTQGDPHYSLLADPLRFDEL